MVVALVAGILTAVFWPSGSESARWEQFTLDDGIVVEVAVPDGWRATLEAESGRDRGILLLPSEAPWTSSKSLDDGWADLEKGASGPAVHFVLIEAETGCDSDAPKDQWYSDPREQRSEEAAHTVYARTELCTTFRRAPITIQVDGGDADSSDPDPVGADLADQLSRTSSVRVVG
ncbi:MAG: hypothetical protein WAW85_03470 [Gordonia sp. (in: high G+C Gram-positive bacteria)]|uniref:hypothetical protein n=1 Tax=Gordonia sp. (in: high G+C Gram-positive bacteria) TaxID=84139 RepID=UPI003BB680A9